jgi:hypothetical protein
MALCVKTGARNKQGFLKCIIYLDDIIIIGPTFPPPRDKEGDRTSTNT